MNIKNYETTSKNYTKKEIQEKKLAEELSFIGNELLESPPGWLRDELAIEKWEWLVTEFKKANIVSNLDYDNLGCYCNAYSLYVYYERKIQKQGVNLGLKENPNLSSQRKYSEEMRKFASLLGLTVQSRLQGSKKALDDENQSIKDDFGDI